MDLDNEISKLIKEDKEPIIVVILNQLDKISDYLESLNKRIKTLEGAKEPLNDITTNCYAKWFPCSEEYYWYYDDTDGIIGRHYDRTPLDSLNILTGNCFKTEAEAIENKYKIRERNFNLRKFTEILEFVKNINQGWKPNWKNTSEEKWIIYYEHNSQEFCTCQYAASTFQHLHTFYFKSQEEAHQTIKHFGNSLKSILELI